MTFGSRVAIIRKEKKISQGQLGKLAGISGYTFDKRMAALRKERKMTQQVLALSTSISVVGRYGRDEMTPSIEVVKKIVGFLDTTVGYLLGESGKADLFKDPAMLQCRSDLEKMD